MPLATPTFPLTPFLNYFVPNIHHSLQVPGPCDIRSQRSFLSDLLAAQAAVCGRNIYNSYTIIFHTQWTAFCAGLQVDHLLEDPNLTSFEILQVYRQQVLRGHYSSQPNQLKAESVSTAWRAISENHLLEGRHDPQKTPRFPREGP